MKASANTLGLVDTSELINGNVMLGIVVWLVVISILLLVLLVLVCKQGRDHEEVKQNFLNDMRDIYQSIQSTPDLSIPYKEFQGEYDNPSESTPNSLSYA